MLTGSIGVDTIDDVIAALSPSERIALLQQSQRALQYKRFEAYKPYPKQLGFHNAGANHRERLFSAANQSGKTYAGAFEVAAHLTGEYPDWWLGAKFDRPTNWLAGSETTELTKKGVIRLLLGRDVKINIGTGFIPANLIDKRISWSAHVRDFPDLVRIKHVTGGLSTISFKTYDQGRKRWQADTVDGVWYDEEPPEDVYTEGLTRTNVSGGPVFITATPLLGMSKVVKLFFGEGKTAARNVTLMGLEEAEHYTDHQRAQIRAQYQDYELEARTQGIPALGSGAVYPVSQSAIAVPAFSIPASWPRIVGVDFGGAGSDGHPTAAVWLAWDRDNDVLYVTDTYSQKGGIIAVHAAAIKARGEWIPAAWPHDGLIHDRSSGKQYATLYRDAGINMTSNNASHAEGGNGVEAGIVDLLERMQTGRLKVFAHLNDWLSEMRVYHRNDGIIVKENDDLMDAMRYAFMMKRFAITKPKAQDNYHHTQVWT
jgi:phage terminase large subunit-like protein